MIFGIGIDLVEIARFADWSDFKLSRIFTPDELKSIAGNSHPDARLAKYFAAREAFLKALGTGFSDKIKFSDVSVDHLKSGQPVLRVVGGARDILDGRVPNAVLHLSLSDEGEYAIASVIIEK